MSLLTRISARGNSASLTLIFGCLSASLIPIGAAAENGTTPEYGIRDKTPSLRAFTNARIVVSPDLTYEKATLVINDGKIVSVGKNVAIPKAARIVDLSGKTIYPAFIDPYTEYGIEKTKKQKRDRNSPPKYTGDRVGGNSWNDAIHSQRNWSEEFKPHKKADIALNNYIEGSFDEIDDAIYFQDSAKYLIKEGFAIVQSVRKDGVFRGRGFTASLGKGLPNDLTLNSATHHFVSFDKGASKQSYPSSLMGSIALIRQTVIDVDWYARAQSAFAANPKQKAPEFNNSLAALENIFKETLIFESEDELSLLRADKIAQEFKLSFIHVGSGYEYARIKEIKATGVELILPINFPKTPEVKTIEDELDVSLGELRHWESAPSNPAALEENGIRFAFTTHGLKKKSQFWKNVRSAVKRGLSEKTALAALTTVPADISQVSELAGTLESGKIASFVVCDGNIFNKETKILSVWISGEENEVEETQEIDHRGGFTLTLQGREFELKLKGKKDKVKGFLKSGENKAKLKNLKVDDELISFSADLKKLGVDGIARFSGHQVGENLVGYCGLPDGESVEWNARKKSDYDLDEDSEGDDEKDDAKKDSDDSADDESDDAESDDDDLVIIANLTFPNIAYGLSEVPSREDVLIKNATVWTSDESGILKKTDVLVTHGKFAKIGKGLSAPSGVRVIDAMGKHLTAGIIDEHSHIAISKGVNEGSEAVTAEVRIGDVVNSDDISIYRILAGGVTISQLLHGSANPIGGQAQVIKLRWGSMPEEMKYKGIDPTIKFALGENVKQSNWGDNYTERYPQTRMGVETIMKDGFRAAREYEESFAKYNAKSSRDRNRTIPPRRDLELDALSDVINSRMFIHCHSYHQSEILMLMRLAEEFGFHIQTFTHILEGYKVAGEMAKHGATASTFADWWAYKFEVYDAIPYNSALMTEKGVISSINSDSRETARRLNQEAAKGVMYGEMSWEEAIKLATINPAIQLRIDDRVGSVTVGKDADFVIWSDNPLSVYAIVEQTWIDGKKYFDLEDDAKMRLAIKEEKSALIQKALASKDSGDKESKGSYTKAAREWHCDDIDDVWRMGR